MNYKSTYMLIVFLLTASFGWAQSGSISGKVLDNSNGDGMISATVLVEGTSRGAVTDVTGNFSVTGLSAGTYTIRVSYIGYTDYTADVTISDGQNTDVGEIRISIGSVGLDEVMVIADMAIDRKTPVAVSTVKGIEIEERVGNQEFPEVLKFTPSIYTTKQGGGFGDARINVRGFDQRNTAVMINGIPVNDMENGWVYWSNWAGLSDVSSAIQVQRGLSASKLAVASVGGTINIVTKASDIDKGGALTVNVGNDGYQKYALSLNSGLMDNGWAFSFQGTRTAGNGYVRGTQFSAWSYFLSASKTVNEKHTFVLTGLGAPQWHHQRLWSRFDNIDLSTFADYDGENFTKKMLTGSDGEEYDARKYNDLWGTLNGEEFTWRRNFYHKPKIFLNHYWTVNDKTEINTSAYLSFGNGGGTGPRGRGANFNFDSSDVWRDNSGEIQWDDIVNWQETNSDHPDWGQNNVDPTNGSFTTSSGPGLIRRASMNYHTWTGLLSTMNTQINDNLALSVGIDIRYYKGEHFRRVENLLGLDSYLSRRDDNNPTNYISEEAPADFGNFRNDSYLESNNVLNYWNDGLVNWFGGFAQLEYSNDRLSAFLALSGSSQGFKRIDYFNYLENDPERETDWNSYGGGTVKGGANFNLNSSSNIFFNAGYLSRQPIFDNVYLNFVNDLNETVENQKIYSAEFGYGYTTRYLNIRANVFTTTWTNRQFDVGVNLPNNEDGLALFTGVGQNHSGLELEITANPTSKIQLRGMASLGNYEYKDQFTATIQNLDTQTNQGTLDIFAEGLKIGDAAQTTLALRADFNLFQGFNFYTNVYHANNLYANWNITDTQFQAPGGQVLEIPAYTLFDTGIIYTFLDTDKLSIRASLNLNNAFDTVYIAELYTNNDDLMTNEGFFGFGRTWNGGLKFRFK